MLHPYDHSLVAGENAADLVADPLLRSGGERAKAYQYRHNFLPNQDRLGVAWSRKFPGCHPTSVMNSRLYKENREVVRRAAGFGLPQEYISQLMVSDRTGKPMGKHFRTESDSGKADATY
jgi:hypothetical protein